MAFWCYYEHFKEIATPCRNTRQPFNGPFPSCLWHLIQNEAESEVFDIKSVSYTHANYILFHRTEISLSLILRVRAFGMAYYTRRNLTAQH